MSVRHLHDGDDDHFPLLMPACRLQWSLAAQIARHLARHAHGESFWQEVEAIFNGAYKDLYSWSGEAHLSGDTGIDDEASTFQYVLGLDDDKLHYNYNKSYQ